MVVDSLLDTINDNLDAIFAFRLNYSDSFLSFDGLMYDLYNAIDETVYTSFDCELVSDRGLTKNPLLDDSLPKRISVVVCSRLIDRLEPIYLLCGIALRKEVLPHGKVVILYQLVETCGKVEF